MARTVVRLAVLVAALAALLAGCDGTDEPGPGVTATAFHEIRPGMNTVEVVAILGEPTERGPVNRSGGSTWRWRDGDRTIDVLFDAGGTVAARGKEAVKYGYNLE